MCTYDATGLKNGEYWAVHMVRPITDPKNKEIIEKILVDLEVE